MGKLRAWLKQKVSEPLLALLTRGLSPQDLSLAVVVSLGLAINPIIGTTTVFCLVAGRLFRLNHLVMQTINHITYPLQLVLIVPFVRLGEMVTGAEALPLSPSLLFEEFQKSFWGFVAKFGMAYVHGLLGWVLVVPVTCFGLYFLLTRLFRRLCTAPDPAP
ncbi:MAG: DUF2062 domain-containing protein [Verrucomicrobia bacterium]|nr:DUF2062 domain-containing protein [Verrucomicrobiota bacterium]